MRLDLRVCERGLRVVSCGEVGYERSLGGQSIR
jgi:hypothetical protein